MATRLEQPRRSSSPIRYWSTRTARAPSSSVNGTQPPLNHGLVESGRRTERVWRKAVVGVGTGSTATRILAPALVGVLVAGAIAGAGFALLTTTIPRPTSGELAGVLAERWLVRHLVIDSRGSLPDGRRFAATCITSWIGPARHIPRRERGSLIVARPNGQYVITLSDLLRRTRFLADVDTPRDDALAELVGCPSRLASRLGDALDRRLPLDFRAVRIFGRPALRFVLGRHRLELYVDPVTSAPMALRLRSAGGGCWARLREGTARDTERVSAYFTPITHLRRSA